MNSQYILHSLIGLFRRAGEDWRQFRLLICLALCCERGKNKSALRFFRRIKRSTWEAVVFYNVLWWLLVVWCLLSRTI